MMNRQYFRTYLLAPDYRLEEGQPENWHVQKILVFHGARRNTKYHPLRVAKGPTVTIRKSLSRRRVTVSPVSSFSPVHSCGDPLSKLLYSTPNI